MSSKGFTQWWNEIDSSRDWEDMTDAEREKAVSQLHDFALDIVELDISENELAQMIESTSVAIVFDSISKLWTLSDQSNKQAITKYLRTIILNSFRESREVKIKYQRPYEASSDFNCEEPVSLDEFSRNSLLNFRKCISCGEGLIAGEVDICIYCIEKREAKLECQYCGNKLQKNNQTGICRKCQKKSRKVLEKQYGVQEGKDNGEDYPNPVTTSS